MNIFFVSLGCDKNLVDSEVMLGLLDAKGYQIVDDETQADVMVINTCCLFMTQKKKVSRRFWIWQDIKKKED